MQSDAELLRSYVQDRSESAFTELVQRHIDLVYSAVLREAHGDAFLAEDVTQAVFAELARKASSLVRHPALAGWLYTCVRQMAANVRRAEDRRQRREQEAQTMNELLTSDPSESIWRQVKPVLDDVMHELGETDRTAVVLRFFEERSLKEVGLALGLNENAARMRVDRALGKLQSLLAKRGVTSTASGLAVAITVGAVVSAPASLAASVASSALLAGASTAATTLTTLKLMTMTKLKLGVIGSVAIASVATPLVMQHQARVTLREENQSLRRRVAQLAQLSAENERLSNQVARANNSLLSNDQLSELMRLRGEVGALRRQLAETAKAQAQRTPRETQAEQPVDPIDQQKQEALVRQQFIAKMGYAKNWMLAFVEYADQHQGQLPMNFDQAVSFLPDTAKDETLLATNQFEIVYQGSWTSLTNLNNVIVLRENESQPGITGGWVRTYGFADGHAEVHKADDGNFEPWEKQHMTSPARSGQ